MTSETQIVNVLLDSLDQQREKAFRSLDGLDESRIWQRPITKDWCIGEILDHTRALNSSFLPLLGAAWFFGRPVAHFRRNKPYTTEIDDVYRRPNFPMNVGWIWPPKYTPKKPVPSALIRKKIQEVHQKYRLFYTAKDPNLLGHIHLYDPLLGRLNLILVLRVCLYHDQLHYQDATRMASEFKLYTTPVA